MAKKPISIAGEYIRKLVAANPNVAKKTLARIAYKENPAMFSSLERARSMIRSVTGAAGEKERKKAKDKSLFRPLGKPGDPFGAISKPISHYEFEWKAVQYNGPMRVLILSDVHIPYHDLKALQVALNYGLENKADFILLNGDFADCHMVSRFERDPRARRFPDERKDVIHNLGVIRKAFPKARIVLKEGNHEERYMSYMRLKAPELLGIEAFELKNLFQLPELNIEHVGEKRPIRLGRLNVIHGHEFARGITSPVNPARGFYMKAKSHVLGGHHHQTSQHSEKNLEQEVISAWSTGALCSMHPDYMPINSHNWGFAFVNVDKDGAFEVENLRIINGKVY